MRIWNPVSSLSWLGHGDERVEEVVSEVIKAGDSEFMSENE